jgi:hypothetical protein
MAKEGRGINEKAPSGPSPLSLYAPTAMALRIEKMPYTARNKSSPITALFSIALKLSA